MDPVTTAIIAAVDAGAASGGGSVRTRFSSSMHLDFSGILGTSELSEGERNDVPALHCHDDN